MPHSSDAHKYLQHATQRAAIGPSDTPLPIRRVGIVGAGTMGVGIAINFLRAGIEVLLLDQQLDTLNAARTRIDKTFQRQLDQGRITEEQANRALAALTTAVDWAGLSTVDLVVEAAFENLDLKRSLFRDLDALCPPHCLLASNTSTLDVDRIAEVTDRPEKVFGAHFFSPANIMPLLEIVRAEKTDDQTIATALSIAQTIGKTPVVVGVCFGFLGNRLFEPYMREAHRLLLEGASAEQIDGALERFGMRMGPLATYDLAGLDVGYKVRQAHYLMHADDPSYFAVSNALVELGHLGQKTGVGFYCYRERERLPNPDLPYLISTQQALYRPPVREQATISDEEIVERCVLSLVNEGVASVSEGIARQVSDIDVTYVNGYGFSKDLGGPMYWANHLGAESVYQKLCHYRDNTGEHGARWLQPHPLLQQLATTGGDLLNLSPAHGA